MLLVEQAICGYGRASKDQISNMVQAILKIDVDVRFSETDAAAMAVHYFFTERFLTQTNLNE
jgi:Holliday junction resolvasome RuvABC endonuclease subunit